MYALVLLVPFVLLGTVLGLSWWEDKLLPPALPDEAPLGAPSTSPASTARPELLADIGSLTRDTPGR